MRPVDRCLHYLLLEGPCHSNMMILLLALLVGMRVALESALQSALFLVLLSALLPILWAKPWWEAQNRLLGDLGRTVDHRLSLTEPASVLALKGPLDPTIGPTVVLTKETRVDWGIAVSAACLVGGGLSFQARRFAPKKTWAYPIYPV